MCDLASTDDHQSAAAVLCPAGQELPLLLWEGEDSEYCCVTASLWAHLWFIVRLWALEARTLLVVWIHIVDAAAHFCNSLSSVCPFVFLFGFFVILSGLFFSLPDFHLFALVFLLSVTSLTFHLPLFLPPLVFSCSLTPVFSLIHLAPALCADEQHPADEGPVGEDVWVDGGETGQHEEFHTHTYTHAHSSQHFSCTTGFQSSATETWQSEIFHFTVLSVISVMRHFSVVQTQKKFGVFIVETERQETARFQCSFNLLYSQDVLTQKFWEKSGWKEFLFYRVFWGKKNVFYGRTSHWRSVKENVTVSPYSAKSLML